MTRENKKPPVVHCPTCHKPVEWSEESTWKPFCSKRCNLIDLGEWFDEKPRIPANPYLPDDEDL